MNVFKIAYRSIQYRGLGSLLTIISMALGVMMVVMVLTIHGIISESFRNNNSMGYNVLIGAQGGSLQLTLNSVYYLSQPIDTLPYEYYLAFCDRDVRQEQLRNSIAFFSLEEYERLAALARDQNALFAAGPMAAWIQDVAQTSVVDAQHRSMEINEHGLFQNYTEIAIPILLGDYFHLADKDLEWRVCATNRDFFDKLVLDVDTQSHFKFAQGRCFDNTDPEVGYFGCVLGAVAARQSGLKIGERIQVTHGIPGTSSSHLHDQEFTVLGILAPTGTPHDRVVFVNMEGFYLINDHIKPVADDSVLSQKPMEVDPFAEEEAEAHSDPSPESKPAEIIGDPSMLNRTPLPIEHREITSVLVRTSKEDPYDLLGLYLPPKIKEGGLSDSLKWSAFRPERAQTGAQAVNPISQVTQFFAFYVDPARMLLLALTIMICVVSGLSILVGIYNSMSQRHHEIAVMRALGANRSKVMLIMLLEAVLLALAGGLLGWVSGHTLNAAISPYVESQTGVGLGFWQFAPKVPVFAQLFGNSILPPSLLQFSVSPELLIVPGLIFLAIMVGFYPAVSAYRTDIAKSLGK